MAGLVPRLSGWILLDWAHDVDSNLFRGFGDSSGHERKLRRASLEYRFHDIIKLVPWTDFDKLVDERQTDNLVRRLTTRQHFLALLFEQLSGATSLRDLTTAMESHRGWLYHCGATPPKRSTLADANKLRDACVFSKLFETLRARGPRGLRRKMGEAIRLIDSTGLRLAGAGAECRVFRRMYAAPMRISCLIPTSKRRFIAR